MEDTHYQELATYKLHVQRIVEHWSAFLARREDMLAQARRFGAVPEKATETLIGSLLTEVLDWTTRDLNWQLDYADLVVTRNYCKHLLLETKRPGALRANRDAIIQAFDQAYRYAAEQHVTTIAVSDAHILRVADVAEGGLKLRCTADLDTPTPPVESLWWISVHGIYRSPPAMADSDPYQPSAHSNPNASTKIDSAPKPSSELLHHKYQLPARCFAYVLDASNPSGWKLPYRLTNNEPDAKRLPKAIQSLLSNYRGTQVGGIPDEAIPAVMRRLEAAAREVGKMPDQLATTANAYRNLAGALAQLPLPKT
jgi:hypothetical protein